MSSLSRRTRIRNSIKALAFLCTWLIALPFVLTWCNLRYELQRNFGEDYCILTSSSQWNGIYTRNGRLFPLPIASYAPDILQLSKLLSRSDGSYSKFDTIKLKAGQAHASWTLGDEYTIPSNGTPFPPSRGIWTSTKDPTQTLEITFYCPSQTTTTWTTSPTTNTSSASWMRRMIRSSSSNTQEQVMQHVRKNPTRRVIWKTNPSWQFIKDHPSTCFLLGLQIGLALGYWNTHIDPNSVAKIYNYMPQEPWRSLSGATAHFDLLHLGFNMSSLLALGTELETNGIVWLLTNMELIVVTTCIMMLLIKLQMQLVPNRRQALQNTSTVGYSGVLFAWMVISSLERTETCPIPMLDHACFPTYQYRHFKFNAGPLVQLVVAQFLLKRVSFVGHLAGIIAGFLLHWNLLPIIGPNIWMPLSLLCLYRYTNGVGNGSMTTTQDTTRSSSNDVVVQLNKMRLVRIRACMTLSAMAGLAIFGFRSGLTWSWLLVTILLAWAMRSHSCPKLWRACILCLTISIICDTMTIAGWIPTICYTTATNQIGFSMFRMGLEIYILVVAVHALYLLQQEQQQQEKNGIFVVVLGKTVLEPCQVLGQALFDKEQHSVAVVFGGTGNVLGTN